MLVVLFFPIFFSEFVQLYLESVFQNTVLNWKLNAFYLVRFILNQIQFNERIMMLFYNIIFNERHVFLKNFLCEKFKLFYFLFQSQFTSICKILFNLYEFQILSGILGHLIFSPEQRNFNFSRSSSVRSSFNSRRKALRAKSSEGAKSSRSVSLDPIGFF